jgi:hypothetical protein
MPRIGAFVVYSSIVIANDFLKKVVISSEVQRSREIYLDRSLSRKFGTALQSR